MAFIVEMFYGTPHRQIIYGCNQDGDLVPMQTVSLPENHHLEWREFSCSWWMWKDTLKIGEQFGWIPEGTLPAEDIDSKSPVLHDYNPDEYLYLKLFQASDAANLANALEKAIPVVNYDAIKHPKLIQPGLSEEATVKIVKGLTETFLKEFIEFLRKGSFKFAVDD